MFTHALTTTFHFSSNGLSKMVYEHLLGCFILEDPSSWLLKLFQILITVAHGDIPKLVALILGANKLLAMAKDTRSFCPITISKAFLQLISHSIILQL